MSLTNTNFFTDQINKLKRDLKISKDHIQDLTRDLNDKEFKLLTMENVSFALTITI